MKRIIAAAIIAVLPAVASASSVYYYVGSPFVVSNFPAEDRPVMQTGQLVVDPSKFTGRRLSGSFGSVWGEDEPSNPGLVLLEYAHGMDHFAFESNFEFKWNRAGELTRWEVSGSIFDTMSSSSSGDRISSASDTVSLLGAHEFLKSLGYIKGTRAYNDTLNNYFDDVWDWILEARSAAPGLWFDDMLSAEAHYQRNLEWALANPARSYYDIAPVPLPAGGWLLLAGLAGLAWVRRRAAA